ncbi:MAG: HEPN domain-containing protein [Blastocatellia bacterium]|nr:HEPN domain-containing protein [Blastocatellia bacterium]
MRADTSEWIEKAEEDWHVLLVLYRARKHPTHNAVCFHAQQCAEKYLKARLIESNVFFPKIHDLIALLILVLPLEPNWTLYQPDLDALNKYAVECRYPGFSATREHAKHALSICRRIREVARHSLDLPV